MLKNKSLNNLYIVEHHNKDTFKVSMMRGVKWLIDTGLNLSNQDFGNEYHIRPNVVTDESLNIGYSLQVNEYLGDPNRYNLHVFELTKFDTQKAIESFIDFFRQYTEYVDLDLKGSTRFIDNNVSLDVNFLGKNVKSLKDVTNALGKLVKPSNYNIFYKTAQEKKLDLQELIVLEYLIANKNINEKKYTEEEKVIFEQAYQRTVKNILLMDGKEFLKKLNELVSYGFHPLFREIAKNNDFYGLIEDVQRTKQLNGDGEVLKKMSFLNIRNIENNESVFLDKTYFKKEKKELNLCFNWQYIKENFNPLSLKKILDCNFKINECLFYDESQKEIKNHPFTPIIELEMQKYGDFEINCSIIIDRKDVDKINAFLFTVRFISDIDISSSELKNIVKKVDNLFKIFINYSNELNNKEMYKLFDNVDTIQDFINKTEMKKDIIVSVSNPTKLRKF